MPKKDAQRYPCITTCGGCGHDKEPQIQRLDSMMRADCVDNVSENVDLILTLLAGVTHLTFAFMYSR